MWQVFKNFHESVFKLLNKFIILHSHISQSLTCKGFAPLHIRENEDGFNSYDK